jgi:hypothetical protein
MGSPVSVTVANLVMEEIEDVALSTFEHAPQFWKRYVDDTITALPEDTVSHFHSHLNSVNPHIKFTVETESDNCLPFLDILLTHESDGNITTSVYRKPIHTDRYLDFSSHHPLAHKVSVIRTLYCRASALSSSLIHRTEEEVHIRTALHRNGYPHCVIRRYNTLSDPTLMQVPSDPEHQPVTTVTLPYVQGVTEAIRRLLLGLDIRVRFYPHSTLCRLLVRPKDPVPPDNRKGVVYRIPCMCCSQSYIGQTGRTLTCRLKEHKRAVSQGDFNASALAEHAVNTGHQIDWSNAGVLDSSQFYYQRLYLESWYIQQHKDTLNRERGLLPSVYRGLMVSHSSWCITIHTIKLCF